MASPRSIPWASAMRCCLRRCATRCAMWPSAERQRPWSRDWQFVVSRATRAAAAMLAASSRNSRAEKAAALRFIVAAALNAGFLEE
jgi:hypothetical protein